MSELDSVLEANEAGLDTNLKPLADSSNKIKLKFFLIIFFWNFENCSISNILMKTKLINEIEIKKNQIKFKKSKNFIY